MTGLPKNWDEMSLPALWEALNDPRRKKAAAASTVEALMFSLRSGVQALGQHNNVRRLSELSDEQLREVAVRVQRFSPHIAPPWNAEDVEVLIAVRSRTVDENS
jgi:hypothetical protein